MKSRKVFIGFAIALILVTAIIFFWPATKQFTLRDKLDGSGLMECVSEKKIITVRGTSMEPLYKPEQNLTARMGIVTGKQIGRAHV